MKKKRWACLLLSFLLTVAYSFASCDFCKDILAERESSISKPYNISEKVFPYAFQTEYTQAEHIERITAITEEKLGDLQERGFVANIWVEIMYAFCDETPRYFLVELTFSEEFQYAYKNKIETSRFQYLIGYIKEDKYYCMDGWSSPNGGDFCLGASAYNYYGYKNEKKYFGDGVCGVACEDGILEIYNVEEANGANVEMHEKYYGAVEQKLVPKDTYERLMNNGDGVVSFPSLYARTKIVNYQRVSDVIINSTYPCAVPSMDIFPLEFQTAYTKEEHIQRIKAITEERFAKSLKSGRIVHIYVDIVHAFYDDDPEYFLVELEFAENFRYEYEHDEEMGAIEQEERYQHVIGYIENDEYYCAQNKENYGYSEFRIGKSAYTYYGYTDAKKYFGAGVQGVACTDGILEVYNGGCEPIVEMQEKYCGGVETRLIAEETYEDLMNNRNKTMFYKQLYKYTLLNFY